MTIHKRRILLVGSELQVSALNHVLHTRLGLTEVEVVPDFLAAVRGFLASPYNLIVTTWDPHGTDMLLQRARNRGPGALTSSDVPIIIVHGAGTLEMSALANRWHNTLVMVGEPPWNAMAVKAQIAMLTDWTLRDMGSAW